MIKLINILLESIQTPKAIIMAGAAGSGKTYITEKYLGNIKNGVFKVKGVNTPFKYMNLDVYVEKDNLPLAKAAQKLKGEFEELKQNPQNIFWDTTGANLNNTLKQINNYKTFMVMVYTHPMVSILQNFNRDRSLPLDAVIKTWSNVYSNINDYKNKLDNFYLIENIPPQYKTDINKFNSVLKRGKDEIKNYLEKLTSSNPDKFKSSFSKEFEFESDDIKNSFEDNIKGINIDDKHLKNLKKDFESKYKKDKNPNSNDIKKKLSSLEKTYQRNQKNKEENLDNLVNKLTSPEFKDVLNPTPPQEVQSKLKEFAN